MRRSRAARNMKNLRFGDFRKKSDNDEDEFRELLGELERLTNQPRTRQRIMKALQSEQKRLTKVPVGSRLRR